MKRLYFNSIINISLLTKEAFWVNIFVQAPHAPGFSRIQSEEMMHVKSNL
jgi:hypothetical protein